MMWLVSGVILMIVGLTMAVCNLTVVSGDRRLGNMVDVFWNHLHICARLKPQRRPMERFFRT
jgi:hypothetical protein